MITTAFATFGVDPIAARRQFQALAKLGDPRAQAAYALMLSTGQGGGTDPATAVHWYRQAAEQEHPVACYSLGAAYTEGRGVAADPAEALRWYRRAAELGDREALWMLGTLERDPASAVGWWRRAATRGHRGAMTCIGAAYVAGNGVPADIGSAAEWFLDAATAGDEEAVQALARVLNQVRQTAETGTPAAAWVGSAFANDPAEAGRLLLLAASKGHGRACHRLAEQARRGEIPGGPERVIAWLERGAAADCAEAQHELGTAYDRGDGVPQDRRAAVAWYQRASAWGRPAALGDLGATLLEVATSEEEREEALDALLWSALSGHAEGMFVYASQVVDEDPVEALRWLIEAADVGHEGALAVAKRLASVLTADEVQQADRRTQTDGAVAAALLEGAGEGG